VVLTERLDEPLVRFLRGGGRVLLAASEGLVRPHAANLGSASYFFTPPANYPKYEDGQNGTIIADHPLLGDFPHEGFADLQFYRLTGDSPPIDLGPLGLADVDPVFRVIHRYPVFHPLGYLVERQVGEGRLVTSALDLSRSIQEGRYLLAQICQYLASAELAEAAALPEEAIARIVDACALPSI
jgi:hypothetical protein